MSHVRMNLRKFEIVTGIRDSVVIVMTNKLMRSTSGLRSVTATQTP